jgi:hypothetical protein
MRHVYLRDFFGLLGHDGIHRLRDNLDIALGVHLNRIDKLQIDVFR